MPEHHLLDLDSLPSAFEPCPECGDVMCQPDPWGEDCDDRARRRRIETDDLAALQASRTGRLHLIRLAGATDAAP